MKIVLSLALMISVLFSISYDEWLKNKNNTYKRYKKNHDEAFSKMLKSGWESYKLKHEKHMYRKTKPKSLPKINKQKNLRADDIKNSKRVDIKPIKKTTDDIIKKVKISKTADKIVTIKFFGTKSDIAYNNRFDFRFSRVSKNSIADFWQDFSTTAYKPLVKQFEFHFDNLNMSDWAKYQFVHKMGTKFYKDKNKANLFSWFILTKLGYDIKVGYNNYDIYLLSSIKHKIYQVSYFHIDGKRYYVLDPSGKKRGLKNIRTYKASYNRSLNSLSLQMNKPMKLNKYMLNKKVHFSYNKKRYKLNLQLNKNLIEFYKTFPQSDYDIYFNSQISTDTKYSLLKSLREIIKNKSEVEAVNILLRFTQNSFGYKTDRDNFGYEKVLFPEETIYYRYSDCEDRTIMFRYLVTNLLKLDVVALKYKDHLASAVAISSKIKGDAFRIKGKIYYVADPTYINANIGQTMSKYKRSMPIPIY
ncbi:MAG: hypothetical protein B1H07_03350 [Campylobacteraceae bacterium 4484_166]|nr:MAG: hypothetical protein B1H07_03350 [Campylobacteraceae bacterium 4484_166]